jgi:NDP-4-keto-2,6-dideoxyhexose 3-C-methyltransferase
MYTEIKCCRVCGNTELLPILYLGHQYLTGIFPTSPHDNITKGPLEIVKCNEDNNGCGLVQLRHSYNSNELYGENYGYRSSLNRSMVSHLHTKVRAIVELVQPRPEDLVLDIGSNDSTLLQAYPSHLLLVGIDPTGKKFSKYYPNHIQLIPDFFSAQVVKDRFGNKKAKIITSISMFYDLEQPLDFMQQVADVLADDGVWVFEQSYMPTMLATTSYDTICHEHLEYYALKQIQWMTNKIGLNIIDVEFNAINGGSFSVMVAKPNAPYIPNSAKVTQVLEEERQKRLHTLEPFEEFKRHVSEHKHNLVKFLEATKNQGRRALGYGASTKGNVILQYCGISSNDIAAIAEVNEDKFGKYTPGTNIPIISEKEAHAQAPDYFLVLPWHFKDNIIEREQLYLRNGGKLMFPLPNIEVISK